LPISILGPHISWISTGAGLKHKLVITLTTVHGSYQLTLSQVAKYIVALFLVLAALSFFLSNSLLMVTSSSLDDLEENHQQLLVEYEEISEHQQQFERQQVVLDETITALGALETERDKLVQLNSSLDQDRARAEAEKQALDSSLAALQHERDSLAEKTLSLEEQNRRSTRAMERLAELETMLGLKAQGRNTEERLQHMHQETELRRMLVNQIPSGLPLKDTVVTAGYGMRNHPVYKKRTLHPGVDFRARQGTPIYATADGVVEYGGYHKSSGFGNLIILQHNYGFKTYFAHLKKVVVRGRQFIRKGQLIGYTGNTGVSTGPHLHYEVRHMFKKLDPKPFLAMNITNVNETFDAVKSVEWASLRKLYPLSLNEPR